MVCVCVRKFSRLSLAPTLSSTAARGENKTRLSSSGVFSMLERCRCCGRGETGLHGQQQVPGAAVASAGLA